MSNIIIIIAVIAIAALLVLRSQQNKESSKPKSAKSKSPSTAKKSNKAKIESKSTPTEPAKPKVDITNVLAQIDVLIADKHYAKAEGIINQSLNKDSNLHELYPKLLDVYILQEDDFAIKQLLESVQSLNLNEVYQQLYNSYEIYKEEYAKNQKLKLSGKTPDIIEYVPKSKPTNALSSFDALAENTSDKTYDTLDFDHLISTHTPESTTPPIQEEAPTLEFNPVSEPQNAIAPETTEPQPTLEFKLDSFTTNSESTATNELEFKFDTSAQPIQIDAPTTLNFSVEQPQNNTASTTSLDFQLNELSIEPPVSYSTESLIDDTSSNTLEMEESSTENPIFADTDDPIVQAFPHLLHADPVELDIDLAEQYINLGEFQAAKNILTQNQIHLSQEQASKVEQLLQKIAS